MATCYESDIETERVMGAVSALELGNSAGRASNAILYTEYARRSRQLLVEAVYVEAAATSSNHLKGLRHD